MTIHSPNFLFFVLESLFSGMIRKAVIKKMVLNITSFDHSRSNGTGGLDFLHLTEQLVVETQAANNLISLRSSYKKSTSALKEAG